MELWQLTEAFRNLIRELKRKNTSDLFRDLFCPMSERRQQTPEMSHWLCHLRVGAAFQQRVSRPNRMVCTAQGGREGRNFLGGKMAEAGRPIRYTQTWCVRNKSDCEEKR